MKQLTNASKQLACYVAATGFGIVYIFANFLFVMIACAGVAQLLSYIAHLVTQPF